MLFTFIEEHKGSRIYSAGLWNVQKRLYTKYNSVCLWVWLEAAGKQKGVCGVHLPVLCKLEAEFRCEEVSCWECNCAASSPLLLRDRGGISEGTELLSNLFVWWVLNLSFSQSSCSLWRQLFLQKNVLCCALGPGCRASGLSFKICVERRHISTYSLFFFKDKVKSFRAALQEEEQASKQINPKRPRALWKGPLLLKESTNLYCCSTTFVTNPSGRKNSITWKCKTVRNVCGNVLFLIHLSDIFRFVWNAPMSTKCF